MSQNSYQIRDPKAQYFSDLWHSQAETLTVEQKDKIGLSFLKHIIGPNEKTAQEFINGDLKTSHAIGMRLGAAEPRKMTIEASGKKLLL